MLSPTSLIRMDKESCCRYSSGRVLNDDDVDDDDDDDVDDDPDKIPNLLLGFCPLGFIPTIVMVILVIVVIVVIIVISILTLPEPRQ